jgi:ribonuclease P protein component
LQHKQAFDAVFREGRRIKTGFFTVVFIPNSQGVPRLGLLIAKRYLSKAVMRNRLRRLLREAFRHNLQNIGAYDLVIMINNVSVTEQVAEWHPLCLKLMTAILRAVSK